jgi:putative ABC transport system permease protein
MVVRRALRDWRRNPATTLATIVTIALATSFLSVAITVVHGVLLARLPYADAHRLVVFDHTVARADLPPWRANLHVVEGLAGAASADHVVRGFARTRILRVAFVSTGFFEVLRPRLVAGRLPVAGESAAVVSERVLREGGTLPEATLGLVTSVVDQSFAVVGVLPADAGTPEASTDIWLPAEAAEAVALVRRDDRGFTLIGRLREGATLAQAAEDATRVGRQLSKADAGDRERFRATAALVDQRARGDNGRALWAFLTGGALMLLIAAANVGSLLLSRTLEREREFAIAFAIGASRRRVALSLFREASLLSAGGTALGLLLASGGMALLRSIADGAVPRLEHARLDWTSVIVGGVVALAVACLSMAGSCWVTLRRDTAPLLRHSEGSGRGSRVYDALASVQLALAVVLVVIAVLLTRTMVNVLDVPTGVRTDGALTGRLMLGERTLVAGPEGRAAVDRLVREVERLPGVRRAGLASGMPPDTSLAQMAIRVIDGSRDETRMMALVAATPTWADAVGLRVVDGRFLADEDAAPEHPGVVVSRSAARHLFGDRAAVGLSLPTAIPGTGGHRARVVGVVDDVRYAGLLSPPSAAIYVAWPALPFSAVRLIVRAAGDARLLAEPVAATIRRLEPGRPIEQVRPLQDVVVASASAQRTYALIAAALATTAFGVALAGLVATVSRGVTLRRRELAVRLTLGATPAGLAGLVLRQAGMMIGAGLLIGLPLAWSAASGVSSFLRGISATDVETYAAVVGALITIALATCAWPIWRAVSLRPIDMLRGDGSRG